MKRTLIVLTFSLIFALDFFALQKTDTPADIQKACIQDDPDLSIASCTAIIPTIHNDPARLGLAYFSRAHAYSRKKDYEHAIEDYNEAFRISPGNKLVFEHRGLAYARKGDYDHAIADLEHIQAHPDDPKTIEVLVIVYNNRGLGYGDKNDYDHAIQDFSKALALDPNFAEALSNRATFEARKGDYDRAIQDFEQVQRLRPNDARAIEGLVITYNARAFGYAENGDYDLVIGDCNEALRLRPNDAETLGRLLSAYNNRGLASGKKGDYDRGIEDFDRALALSPVYAEGFNNRGTLRSAKGDYEGAIQDFDQALRLNPKLAKSFLGRGFTYFGKHDFDRAIKDYEEALRLDPGNADATNQLNRAHMVRGDFNRSPTAKSASEAPSTEHQVLTVKNILAFQATFGALKSNGFYRGGFAWPGLYEIGNPGDKAVTITDFRVLWQQTSFQGHPLKLVTRAKPDRIAVFEDLDALIKTQEEKADPAGKKFPISIPSHTTRYLVVHFFFDVISGDGELLKFGDEKEAYKLLSVALGWKPDSDGDFYCLNDDVEIEILTADQQRLKSESLTGLLVPGCAIRMPPKQEKPLVFQSPAIHNSNGSPGPTRGFTLGSKSQAPAGLSTEDYTKLILREPNNADAFNERGKAYRAKGEYDRAIQDFTEATRLRTGFVEAQKNLEEAKHAKTKAACGFQLFCKD